MTARVFVDTNVLVYLYDTRDARKQARARAVFEELGTERFAPVISTQVLQEAFVALTRKLSIPAAAAIESLKGLEHAGFSIQGIGTDTVWRAAVRSEADRLSFWDSLILESALAADCPMLYSEDLQAGRQFGTLQVVNPFAPGAPEPARPRSVNDRRR
jgi:predicted nucleic acid-binding protein